MAKKEIGWVCPKCGSKHINTFRHPNAKVWCVDCDFVLRDEGSVFLNSYDIQWLYLKEEPSELKETTMIYATDYYVECPYCKGKIDGWVDDPRGHSTRCDFCGKMFMVHSDADVEIM